MKDSAILDETFANHANVTKQIVSQKPDLTSSPQSGFINDIDPNTPIEKIEEQVKNYLERTVENLYNIGKLLQFVNENKNLYLSRGYKSFDSYVQERFNITARTAYDYIYYTKFNEVCVRTHGTKLRLTKPLKPEETDKVVKWMDSKQPSFREIQERVASLRTPIPKKPQNQESLKLASFVKTISSKSRLHPILTMISEVNDDIILDQIELKLKEILSKTNSKNKASN